MIILFLYVNNTGFYVWEGICLNVFIGREVFVGKWEGVEEFVAVSESGGFTAAARVLGVSKAHISQQVNRLEDRLGTRLLLRTTRRVSLTETGALYLARCRSILDDLDDAETSVSSLQAGVRGRIRLSSPHLLGEVVLVPALTLFQQQHPDLEIDIDLTSRRVDLIDGNYDVAIQLGARKDVSVVNRALAVTTFHVVASPGYLAEHGIPGGIEALKSARCLLFAANGESKPWKFQRADGVFEVRVKGGWRSNSGHLLRAAARQGLGLAYLPDYYLKDDLERGALVSVMPEWQSINRKVVAIYQHRAHLTTKIKVFLDFLSQYFEQQSHLFSDIADD